MPKLPSHEGQSVPNVKFRYREDGEWKEIDSKKLFGGRTVAVFSLPGVVTTPLQPLVLSSWTIWTSPSMCS